MKLFVKNIGTLAGLNPDGLLKRKGAEMSILLSISDAWLFATDGIITAYGSICGDNATAVSYEQQADTVVDAEGGTVLPSFCDSHTHIVFAGSREQEFVDKINGLSYAEIARKGGGILNSADRLHNLSEDELYEQSMHRVREIIKKGTGAVEIKSGYGLSTEDELKMLRVIRRIKETTPLKVMSTFLGAHAVARGYSQSDYVNLVINEMIPAVAAEGLADFIDVFCDEGFFTFEETSRILEAGARYGMRGKIHGEELAPSGGVEVALKHSALSVDHLESMTDEDIEMMRDTDTMPTALPGTSFFLNMPFAPGRKMISAGLPLAIASDYNPGSTPSGDMKFAISLACIKMRLQPEEAINAATINGAAAMGLSNSYGSLAPGMVANFFITQPIPSLAFIPYAYTTPIIRRVFLQGKEVE
ncbi:imidazolonepropionase [Prevotella koreensis]|uniref:Imidazolonepropionase n=1 Tax=Prevotella koreensis TaxID=2490854 RepID=A0A432LJR4_9BACT|nr:imidazolonepropionase [Prevotella koreensis]RUL58910.1 imidazolonepropionase [Prevotella koreensis]